MDESLSLKFNTLENMKTVGNYEAELKKLSEENFELKHQVEYLKANQNGGLVDNNIHNLLYESKQSIDILENENKKLSKQVDNLKEVIKSSSSDRENLISKLKDYENRLAICEEENDRLLNHLNSVRQKSDSLIEDYKEYEVKIKDYEKTIREMKLYIESLEKDKDLYFTEGNKLLETHTKLQNDMNAYNTERAYILKNNEDLKNQVNELVSRLDELNKMNLNNSNINEKLNKMTENKKKLEEELDLQRKEWDLKEEKLKGIISEYVNILKQKNSEIEANKNNSEYSDLKSRYEKDIHELKSLRRENENLLNEMKTIRESYSHLKRKLEVVEDDRRALKYKIAEYEEVKNSESNNEKTRSEYKKLKEHYERLKRVHQEYRESVNQRLVDLYSTATKEIDNISSEIQDITERVNSMNVKRSMAIEPCEALGVDCKQFLTNLNIPVKDINEIVSGFSKVYEKMKNKIDVLNNEVKDITKFNDAPNNNRMKEVVQKFISEFKNAREDLNSTKAYLEKKSKEIKEVKKEKEVIEKKFNILKTRYEELKMKDVKIKESYNGILNTLKKKDELINKLEMRMIH